MNKFNNLLIRTNGFQDGCTNSFFTNAFHKLADDWQGNISFKKGKAPLEDDAPQNVIVLHVNRHFSCIKGPDDDHLRPLRKCRTATFE